MNRRILLVALLALMLVPLAAAQRVDVGLYVLNLGKFDVATGSFTADFYLSMKCDSECSTDFEFMNGRAASVDMEIDKPNEKFYRIQANLNSPVDLRNFPFDRQRMEIVLEDKLNTIEELQYFPNIAESGIDDSITFTGWNIDGWGVEAREHRYGIYDETYSQYAFTIDISRIFFNSFLKTFLPVIFIVLILMFSFLMDPDKIITRLTIASSSLVAAVMYHVSISNQIPPVGYLTLADKFMILTYFIVLASAVLNIVMLQLTEWKKQDLVERMHRRTEYSVFIVVPLLYILFFVIFAWL